MQSQHAAPHTAAGHPVVDVDATSDALTATNTTTTNNNTVTTAQQAGSSSPAPSNSLPTHQSIAWPCSNIVRSVHVENALKPIVLRPGEFGRGRDLPPYRLQQIETACVKHGMTHFQALSMRRQLLRAQPGGMVRVNRSSAMGSAQGQQHVAQLFESAVAAFLHSQGLLFRTGTELQAEACAARYSSTSATPFPAAATCTPDILFSVPTTINGSSVAWLDCKLFYGCYLLSSYKQLPVGKLRGQAERYNARFGSGGFVFGQGFCADLARVVPAGVVLLDATPIDMTQVTEYQNSQN